MIFSVGQLVPFLVVIVLAIGVGYALNAKDVQDGILYTVLGSLILCAIICLNFYVKSLGTHYRITTQRIKLESNLLNKVQENLELFRIDHFELRKPLRCGCWDKRGCIYFPRMGNFRGFRSMACLIWKRSLRHCGNASFANARDAA